MPPNARPIVLVLAAGLGLAVSIRGEEKTNRPVVACAAAADDHFEDEVWTKVGARKYPGDKAPSPNWPKVAPGRWGVVNAFSPKYCDLSEFAAIASRAGASSAP